MLDHILAKVSKNHILSRDFHPSPSPMADKSVSPDGNPAELETAPATPVTPVPPKRGPGHRGADVKDTVAEMAAKAHEISLEAGSKMAAAMKDVINAAAGLTGFVLESARDLVQYMVRRGQMTQEEADKLIRQAEEAQVGRPAPAKAPAAKSPAVSTPAVEAGLPARDNAPDPSSTASDVDDNIDAPPAKKSAAKSADKAAPAAKKTAAKAPAAAKKAAPKKK
jgi:hypothetical protein